MSESARDNVRAMQDLSAAYSRELAAQWHTLRLLTGHNGENGRVHEHFLRAVLRRFLPLNVHLGTGFIATQAHTSTQTDLLIYEAGLPLLFSAGDLVVADARATLGGIEVKTSLDGRGLRQHLEACYDTKTAFRVQSVNPTGLGRYLFYALYAIDGIERETVLAHFREWAVDKFPHGRQPFVRHTIPDVIYVRGKYILLRDHGMSDPYMAVDVPALGMEEGSGDGLALMLLVACLYRTRYHGEQEPWWLRHLSVEDLPGELIAWPAELNEAGSV